MFFPSFGNCVLRTCKSLGAEGATHTHTHTQINKSRPDSTELIVQWENRHQTDARVHDQISGSMIDARGNRIRISESTSQADLGYLGKEGKVCRGGNSEAGT